MPLGCNIHSWVTSYNRLPMDGMLVAEGSFWPNYADQQRSCGIRELKMQCRDSGHLHPIISDSLSAEPPIHDQGWAPMILTKDFSVDLVAGTFSQLDLAWPDVGFSWSLLSQVGDCKCRCKCFLMTTLVTALLSHKNKCLTTDSWNVAWLLNFILDAPAESGLGEWYG
jgi:hypothetical protein